MMQDDDGRLVARLTKAALKAEMENGHLVGKVLAASVVTVIVQAALSAIEREGWVIRREKQIERDAECPSCRGTKGRHFMGCQRPIGTIFG